MPRKFRNVAHRPSKCKMQLPLNTTDLRYVGSDTHTNHELCEVQNDGGSYRFSEFGASRKIEENDGRSHRASEFGAGEKIQENDGGSYRFSGFGACKKIDKNDGRSHRFSELGFSGGASGFFCVGFTLACRTIFDTIFLAT